MLAHDLSNALETIVQATYLISQAAPPENLRRWVELIDQASEEAVKSITSCARFCARKVRFEFVRPGEPGVPRPAAILPDPSTWLRAGSRDAVAPP